MLHRQAFIIAMSLSMASGLAQASQRYSVVDVASGDALNVRADVAQAAKPTEAAIVGTIPADAGLITGTGLSITIDDRIWKEIVYGDIKGWVSSRFLKPEGPIESPGTLACSGTEPFWSLSLDARTATYRALDNKTAGLRVITNRGGQNRPNIWSYRMISDDGRPITALLVHSDQCSDGMSDYTYAFEVFLLGLEPDDGPLQGCCTAQLK